MFRNFRTKSFTLIELLIVVAIIGILAVLAIPNFMNAAIRAKVAHVKGELHTLHTAIESYKMDSGEYPIDAFIEDIPYFEYYALSGLSTPINYLSAIPSDDFFTASEVSDYMGRGQTSTTTDHSYFYAADGWMCSLEIVYGYRPEDFTGQWIAVSVGPDNIYSYGEWIFLREDLYGSNPRVYNPSNGIVSNGDISRWGP